MFVASADEDYLVARAAARRALHHQFAWSSQQVLEKLLKAILLMNGKSISPKHEGLSEQYKKCLEICGDLLPMLLCPPNEFLRWEGFGSPFFEPVEKYFDRVEQVGDPQNRYRVFSIESSFLDLHKLDQSVFMLRRVAIPMDLKLRGHGCTAREFLQRNRSVQLTDFRYSFAKGREREILEEDLKWNNWSFCFEDAAVKRESVPHGAYINSEIFMLFQKPDLKAAQWIAEHAFTPKIRRMTLQEIDKAKGHV